MNRPPLDRGAPIDTTTVLGRGAEKPLVLDVPLLVAAPNAMSPESRVALARGAAEAGTAVGSGGGVAGRERVSAGAYLLQLPPGVPVREIDLTRADAVELEIGGDPTRLPGFRDLPEHAGVTLTTPVGYAPTVDGLPDYVTELASCVAGLRNATGGVPIGLRVTPGDLEADVAVAARLGVDFLTIAAGETLGLPSLAAVTRARRLLGEAPGMQLVAAGGFRTPDEMAKALALGADAISLGTAGLIAMGCQQYRACEQGSCPVGIATHQAELRLRFNADISAHRLATFLAGATEAIAMSCRMAGRHAVAGLCRDDLLALTADAARVTGLPYLR
jgi:glutamate synthase domain-containing protein 2